MDRIEVGCCGQNPEYATLLSSGADLRACLDQDLTLLPGERALIPTGIRLSIPAGYEGQVRPRSGLALKHGISIPNAPGTIDADYRGEIKVLLINFGKEAFVIKNRDRIAQIIFTKVVQADFIPAESLDVSARGDGGFGSSGTH